MKNSHLLIAILLILILTPANAQKQWKKVRKANSVVVKEPTAFDKMLDNTQQIIFVDSVVVDKQQFLQYYRLTAETGTVSLYNDFFQTDEQPYSTVYVNQLGNKCWYANDGHLYTSDRLSNQWSTPQELEGLGTFQRTNYPFMLSDGTTLYFSAIGDEGVGGLDIYVSRYDSENGKFLLAENLGMPFNSEANDYMYAVDELNGIGYFATDRRQPEGNVCIYTFIPNEKRIIYHADQLDEATIRSRARIDRIADTWGDGQARQEVLNRIKQIEKKQIQKDNKQEFLFAINNDITYYNMSDFRNPDSRTCFEELTKMQQQFSKLADELEKSRTSYATKAPGNEKNALRAQILGYEQEYYQLEQDIHQLEKKIRNNEIKFLNP